MGDHRIVLLALKLILDGYKIFPRIDENNKLISMNEIKEILSKKELKY